MRGTLLGFRLVRPLAGNTPADAGNSRFGIVGSIESPKHPRRCGELKAKSPELAGHPETPPQMRGTHREPIAEEARHGNTPADAGNSALHTSVAQNQGKHPRRCGELTATLSTSTVSVETPPQMRGTRYDLYAVGDGTRNTPADAGNSALHTSVAQNQGKHPRRCGELH